VFSMWSVPRCYKQGTRKVTWTWTLRGELWDWKVLTETEESPLLEAVAMKLLVKAHMLGSCGEVFESGLTSAFFPSSHQNCFP
jgi:hypothetical protein